ncbi:succinyl-diaminopimelate desuccinylase [Pseudonocardia sediminis]|uniref:Succinyl-diaminopimelate desuccinylase n=1 Tax=Pseudonocardia sediminis TaxID=1397368 RepID=A0A4V2FR14_PSEST|nr:M20 family metallopeptidase [Pseudonocardia sediminis]RZT86810.1 succinyl-diaminopimelate desuccinylase [Pseudonocardia sediminis]
MAHGTWNGTEQGAAELLSTLVRQRSVSGGPDGQVAVIETVLAAVRAIAPDVRCESELDGDHPWALLGTGGTAPVLFACHVDTVPVGSTADWSVDPFGGEIADGLVHGRGASDMKAGVVASAAGLVEAARRGTPAALLLTSDEEVGCLGAAQARDAVRALSPSAVVIPEATHNRVHLGHRGALWLRVVSRGRAAHGSTPDLGVNAIARLADLTVRARTELPLGADPYLGPETLNLGTLSGGTATNIVPDRAEARLDHRIVGDGADLLAWWERQPEADEVTVTSRLPAVTTSAGDPWVARRDPASEPVRYFTDASVLAPVLPGVPIAIWGPGDPARMHAVDENVAVSELEHAIGSFRGLVR